ncbi:hypothetical protein [uncultured Corynebacterium sp.]|uniref:hypothetical protein n=1 Tax=uncultured Corynebacterium sp. TaxID=159447 RepID=UPI0025F3130E|nr:hypothetical protein [uncultured Corynebacterium sp.]
MTIKKSLLAVATASAVAIAGTGVANAKDGDLPANHQGSSDASLENSSENLLGQLEDTFGSYDDDGFNIQFALESLLSIAAVGGAVAGSITVLPKLDGAIKDFQEWLGQYTGQAAAQDAE